MCGIFGAVGDPDWVAGLRLDRAVGAMGHRGPDHAGKWRSPSLDARDGGAAPACVLGHTRLSILDLSDAGWQPTCTRDRRHVLVFNGEIYNFREIRHELETTGETFTSSGDSEVVLKSLVRWGPAAVERFRGMFALGLWDELSRTLLLARDRLGVKPLYVTSSAGGIAFASEVRTLLAAGASQRVLSPRGLLGYLRFGSVQEPDTLISGVRSLGPGTTAFYDGSELRERAYWVLPAESSPAPSRTEAVASIRALLRDSVRIRLVSDVPFGIFLSGGVDSSALAALSSAETERPVHTFTVTFDEAAYSEEARAAEVAGRYGCIHHSVRVRGEEAGRDLPEFFRGQDQPSGDGLNSWLVARAARQAGLAMALSGLGADEIFAGYPGFRQFSRLVKLARVTNVFLTALEGFLERQAARPGSSHRLRKAIAVLHSGGTPEGVYRALREHFTPGQIRGLLPGAAYRRARQDERPAPAASLVGDGVNDFSRLDLAGYLRNTLLRDTDSMSMASSLEVRVPFLDHRLVEYVVSLPGSMKVEGPGSKSLLFDAVPELPREAGLLPKVGFVLPLKEWFRGPMRKTIEEALVGLQGPSAGVLRRRSTEALWSSFLMREGTISASRVLTLASLATWVSEHDLVLPW